LGTGAAGSDGHAFVLTEIASEGLKGRVFEVNLSELQGGDEELVSVGRMLTR
jgi:hypothetical protein